METRDIPTKIPFFSPYEGEIGLTADVRNDRKGNLKIQLWCDDGPYLTLTKDLDKECDPDCAYIDHLASGESLTGWLQAQGIGVTTGSVAFSGFCAYDEIQFNPEFLDCYRNGKEWKNPEWVWCTVYRDSILGGYTGDTEGPESDDDNLIVMAVKKEWLLSNLDKVFDIESIIVPDKMTNLGDILDRETGEEFTTADTETQIANFAIKDPMSGAFVCKEFFLTSKEKAAADRINYNGRMDQLVKKQKKPRKKAGR